ALELNVWTKATFAGGEYDERTGRWTVRVRRDADGKDSTERVLRPRHVVLATGMSSVPNIPVIPGANEFEGTIQHSTAHKGGLPVTGKPAIIVGCCNSGHDIAQSLYEQGADVTMVQRSSTYVMTSENGIKTLFAGTYEEAGPPVDEADLIFASIPYPLLAVFHQQATAAIAELDREVVNGLE